MAREAEQREREREQQRERERLAAEQRERELREAREREQRELEARERELQRERERLAAEQRERELREAREREQRERERLAAEQRERELREAREREQRELEARERELQRERERLAAEHREQELREAREREQRERERLAAEQREREELEVRERELQQKWERERLEREREQRERDLELERERERERLQAAEKPAVQTALAALTSIITSSNPDKIDQQNVKTAAADRPITPPAAPTPGSATEIPINKSNETYVRYPPQAIEDTTTIQEIREIRETSYIQREEITRYSPNNQATTHVTILDDFFNLKEYFHFFLFYICLFYFFDEYQNIENKIKGNQFKFCLLRHILI